MEKNKYNTFLVYYTPIHPDKTYNNNSSLEGGSK